MSPTRSAGPHVGLNLIFLVPGETGGMEIAAQELIAALIAGAPPGFSFTAFVNRETAAARAWPLRDALPRVRVPVTARRREQWVLGEQVLLAPMAMRSGAQLVHSLASTAPLWGRFRRVVTIHDLIYARFPEAHAGFRDKGMGVLVPAAARRSDRVIAISQSTRRDLVELVGLAPERIDVIPNGLGASRREQPLSEAETRERFQLGERRVLLALSAKRPHKNLPALIDALALIGRERRPLLVLPGYRTWHEDELTQRARPRGVEQDLRMPGWVSASELEGLWALAGAFVFPSLYEGFGLPVLEAMARGVPVACSNAASLPEVAGDAALLFDPRDTRAMAQAIERLLAGGPEIEQLRTKGRERVAAFSWERTARLTLETYARTLSARRPSAATPSGA